MYNTKEIMVIKEYLSHKEMLEERGREGILNKFIGKKLSIFEYDSDDEECAKKYFYFKI